MTVAMLEVELHEPAERIVPDSKWGVVRESISKAVQSCHEMKQEASRNMVCTSKVGTGYRSFALLGAWLRVLGQCSMLHGLDVQMRGMIPLLLLLLVVCVT